MKLSHPNIKIRRVGGNLKRRSFFSLGKAVSDNLVVYNNTVSVALRALTERLYYVKDGAGGFKECPKPSQGSFQRLARYAKCIKRNLCALPPVWTRDEFRDHYTGPKFKRYQKAVERLSVGGVSRKHGYLSTFIKAELYNASNKPDPCPRLIQPRSPVFNVEVGRFLRPMEKLIYGAIDRMFGHKVVLKCEPPWDRAKVIKEHWDSLDDPCFVGLDASRFDQHVSDEALQFEHSVYTTINRSRLLAWLLTMQRNQRGFANMSNGTIEYVVQGCRASGDMNTALGNVILMCVITLNYLERVNVPWRFINDGDDCGIFINRRDLFRLAGVRAHFLEFGFELTIEDPVFVMEHIEFCQSRPVQFGESSWMMVRNIAKALNQDETFLHNRPWASLDEIRHATGVCGLALYEGCPILDAFYRSMLGSNVRAETVTRLCKEAGGWQYHASKRRQCDVDVDVARASVYRAFGYLPDHQIAIEDEMRARVFSKTLLVQIEPKPVDRKAYYIA